MPEDRPPSPYARPAATRIITPGDTPVPVGPPGVVTDDRVHVRSALEQSLLAIQQRNLAGTRKLTFGSLLQPTAGLMVTVRATRVSPNGSTIDDAVEWLGREIIASKTKKALVLAGPGEGKTTTSLFLFQQIADAYLKMQSGVSFPILIDLRSGRHAVASPEYGTTSWINSFLEIQHGKAVQNLSNSRAASSRPVCTVLDSLDEVLAGHSFIEVRDILERDLFTQAAVVFCRSHFYEQYLQYLPFVNDREVICLSEWDVDDLNRYVRNFYKLVRPRDHDAASTTFLDWMHGSSSLSAILRIPIRLNMALDMYSPEGEVFPQHRTLLQLYEAYISWSINLERSRTGVGLEDTYRLLEDIAWETYGERDSPTGRETSTTDRSLMTFLAGRNPQASNNELEKTFDAILDLGLLAINDDPLPGRDREIDFVHKSFQECLVATRVAGAIATSPQESAMMCASYLTPEVSEFLKEAIERLNSHPRDVIRAVGILTDAITRAGSTDIAPDATASDRGRKRLMMEQLCYYLGNLESTTAQGFLLALIDKETDEWIRRGIIVGLAFGGVHKPLDKYVADLRDERSAAGDTPKSDANIGFHLSYFGDQPFDPEAPDRDMGFGDCEKTVTRLIYQLGTTTNRPNWKIDLYTLLDLKYRSASEASYWAHMRAGASSLRRVYDRFSRDTEARNWAETADLAEILKDSRLGP